LTHGLLGGKQGFPRERRIVKSREIVDIIRNGRRYLGKKVDVFARPSDTCWARLGVIVPKHGMQIVDRNRLKRRLREIGRRRVLGGLDSRALAVDLIIRARPKAYDSSFSELRDEVCAIVKRVWQRGC